MMDMPEIPRCLVGAVADVAFHDFTDTKDFIISILGLVTLNWDKHPSAEVWRCNTPIGTYKVFAVSRPASWDFDGFGPNGTFTSSTKTADSTEAAKAAALAHYRAAWLSAIHVDRDTVKQS